MSLLGDAPRTSTVFLIPGVPSFDYGDVRGGERWAMPAAGGRQDMAPRRRQEPLARHYTWSAPAALRVLRVFFLLPEEERHAALAGRTVAPLGGETALNRRIAGTEPH
jgi:hypothetical protein